MCFLSDKFVYFIFYFFFFVRDFRNYYIHSIHYYMRVPRDTRSVPFVERCGCGESQ